MDKFDCVGGYVIKVLQLGMDGQNGVGGIGRYLLEQYKCLDNNVIRYDFLHMRDEPIAFDEELSKKSSIFLIPERKFHPFKHYIYLLYFFYKIRKRGYDAIIMNTGCLSQALPLLLAKLIGIPMRVIHSHASGLEGKAGCLRRCQYAVNRKIVNFSVTEYWACSKKASEFLFLNKDARIIRNGIDVKKFLFSTKIRDKIRSELNVDKKFVVGHVGRFSPVKNHLFLLDVFYEFYKSNKNAVLLLVGNDKDFPNEYYINLLKNKIRDYHLEDVVIFTGYKADVSKYYQAMDLFCLPSISEGLSIFTLEAQATGLPCIVSTGVPNDVKVSQQVTFLPLNKKEMWIEVFIKAGKEATFRRDRYVDICRSGYDVRESTKKLEEHFIEVLGHA